jgi:hypothetical protein
MKFRNRRMEGEQRVEQEAYIQAHIQLPPGQVHQSRSKGLGCEVVETPDEAGTSGAPEASKI